VIAGLGFANEHMMVGVGLAGVLVGDGVTFALGRIYGERIARFRLVARVLSPSRIAMAKQKFTTHGTSVMFVARFLPGLRTPVFFAAGMSHSVSYAKWLLMDGTAALLSVPVWVYVGFFGARNFQTLFEVVERGQSLIIALLVLGGLILVGIFVQRRRSKQE
jgi:membrane protein DedA with SNARE-associated domain